MRLCSCERPTYLKNPYTGELVCSPCGTCPSCMNLRAKKWINNLDVESRQHKYTFMLNLTYDQDNVPCLQYCEDDPNYVEYANRSGVRIPLSEFVAYCRDSNGDIVQKELDYIESRLAHPLGLPCICTDDISKFFKRLNKYCFTHITKHYENFRYFCAHEYGPTTYRCHAHLLVWFDSDEICKRFQEIISACWKFGDCSASAVYSDGGRRYVAQYVNSLVHLPSVYSHPKMRQRTQFSKCPSIGSFNLLEEEIRRLYDECPTTRTVWNASSRKFVDIPIQTSIKSRFFPKLEGYNDLLHLERVVLYGTCLSIPADSFEEFKSAVLDCCWLCSREIHNFSEGVIAEYYVRISELCRNNALRRRYSELKQKESLDCCLKRWYMISKRICTFALSLGCTVNYLVERIEYFWNMCDYESMKRFYEWQNDYLKFHGKPQDLLCAYPELYSFVNDNIENPDLFGLLSYPELSALWSFGIYSKQDFVHLLQTYDHKSMVRASFKIFKDTHKAHSANRYLYSRKFKNSDSKLQQIIIDYKNA